MKANEAPEKIYVKITHPISDKYTELIAFEHGNGIEYTRTDAFMKKILEWLRKGGERGDAYIVTEFGENVINFVKLAEDFKNYMKGE